MKTDQPSAPHRRRKIRWILRLVLALAGVIVGLFAVEFLIQKTNAFGVLYPQDLQLHRLKLREYTYLKNGKPDLDGTLFIHRPNTEVRMHGWTVAINACSLRGPEIAKPKPADTFRYLMLGDSVTFGWGIDDEDTFSRRLELELNAAARDGRRYEVLNAGSPEYDTVQELAFLREHGLALQPDAVVLTYIANDIVPTRRLAELLLAPPPESAPEPSWLDKKWLEVKGWFPATTQFLRLFREQVLDGPPPAVPMQGEGKAIDMTSDEARVWVEGWERSKKALREMRDLCRAAGIPFLVMDQSVPRFEEYAGPDFSLERVCHELGIPIHDMRFTSEERAQGIVNSLTDPHANRLGNTFMLRKLQRALAAEGLPSGS